MANSYLPGGPQPDPSSPLGFSNGTALNGILAYYGFPPDHLVPAGTPGAVAVLFETGVPGAQGSVTEQAVIF